MIEIAKKNRRPHGDCPTEEFERGLPRGKCEGDGHFLCASCKHYNEPQPDSFPELIYEMVIPIYKWEATINPGAADNAEKP